MDITLDSCSAPIIYWCPECGKRYCTDDYHDDDYCVNCGYNGGDGWDLSPSITGNGSKVLVIEPKVELLTPVTHLVDYEKLIEQAGRTCYASGDKITADSAGKFIDRIIRSGHHSVIEHCSISYRFILSRAASHQAVRHRLTAVSQESMRYCDFSREKMLEDGKFKIIVPPTISADPLKMQKFLISATRSYEDYIDLRNSGIPPEDARFVLPHCSKTELVMTANIREWRHIIEERGLNPHAQWEIRQLMKDVLYELNHYLPNCFKDLVVKLTEQKENTNETKKS